MVPGFTLFILACSPAPSPLAALDSRYRDIMVELGVADRDTARNVLNQEARARKSRAEEDRVAFFRDPEVQDAIDGARAGQGDPLEHARADAYWRQMIVARKWTAQEKAEESRLLGKLEELGTVEATWRSPDGAIVVNLEDTYPEASRPLDALPQVLRDELATAYIAQASHGLSESLVDLIHLRNEVARREGFDNYWQLSLASQGLTPKDVDDIIRDLTAVVTPLNQEVLARIQAASTATGQPLTWANLPMLRRAAGLEIGRDQADAYFDTDRAEERVTSFFSDMGINVTGLQVYSGPSRYVRPGVYGFPIEPPDSVAIVMSQDRRWSVWQYEALAHETGHAVWWRSLGPDALSSPVMWEPPAPWFEGFATFFERQVYSPAFTERYVPELPAAERQALADWRASRMAGWITDSIVETLVERRLYEDPTNLAAVARAGAEIRARLTGLPTSPEVEGSGPYEPALLSSILWNYPAYAQNYLFAYMTEAWMDAAVRDAVGDPIGNPKVGPLLVEKLIQAPGAEPFPDRLAALEPGDRAQFLKNYIKGPPQAPEIPAKTNP